MHLHKYYPSINVNFHIKFYLHYLLIDLVNMKICT